MTTLQKHNMKKQALHFVACLLLFILILLLASPAKAQTKVPDCDSSSNAFTVIGQPCKVPVYKSGKIVGYTERNYHWGATTNLLTLTGNSTGYFNSFTPSVVNWLVFSYPNHLPMSMDNPEKTPGKYIIHIKRKYLHWLNDSTAVYTDKPFIKIKS